MLLLHRVRTSSSFPSAHVFPGGNCSTFHDGELPSAESPDRHQDSEAYRLAAIRETFEESGILLARNNGFGRLIEVDDKEREEGRRQVHSNEIDFRKWLAGKGGRADVGAFVEACRLLSWQLTLCRWLATVHSLDHTYEYTETLHNANVHLLFAPVKLAQLRPRFIGIVRGCGCGFGDGGTCTHTRRRS